MEANDVRELLRQGQTGQALEALLVWVRKDARYKNNLARTLEVLQIGYEQVRRQELKGILSFQEAQREYSKVADAILSILDDVEAGRVPAAAVQTGRTRMFAGAAVLVLAVLGVWYFWGNNRSRCPGFADDKALHVLVLPFDPLDARTAAVELRIQDDISRLTQKAKLAVEVRIGKRDKENGESSLQMADRNGKRCEADLVIFGQYKAFEQDSLRINLGYRFLGGKGQAGDVPFQTFRDITEIKAPRDLEDALFSLCAMIAMREQNWGFARRWMDKIREKDPSEEKMAQWLAGKQQDTR
ncbi:MAG: hypothetical protein IPM98_02655 [Lewinellaceae bacterium]|nr:hypothetical protein [Lewinellaceae bacterium]